MSSSSIRGIRRKKSSLSEVKIALFGAPSVGKSELWMEAKTSGFPIPPYMGSLRSVKLITWLWSFCSLVSVVYLVVYVSSNLLIAFFIGLTALIVRFLTKRYIGEYDQQSEQRYKNEVLVDNEPVLFEILDTCNKAEEGMPTQEIVNWADGFMLVYSITDRKSFNWIKRAVLHICEKKPNQNSCSGSSSPNLSPSPPPTTGGGDVSPTVGLPMVLLANKADMVHLRQVGLTEGEMLAKDLECPFSEVAASEHVSQVAAAFHELFREVQTCRKRSKTSLLDRVLGSKASKIYVRGKSDSALPKDSPQS